MTLKKEVFAEIDARRGPARSSPATPRRSTSTSSARLGRPESVVGLHFFSPAHVMRLRRDRARRHERRRRARRSSSRSALQGGVVVRNAPGFVGNRMMFPYMYEAQFLAEEGASPEQVDAVLTDFGMAMGIFAVDDMGGLDVAWRIRKELRQFEERGARSRSSRTCWSSWAAGPEDRQGLVPLRRGSQADPGSGGVALVESVRARTGIERRPISRRGDPRATIYALVNEGARALGEGIARARADIDVIYLTGYGFPAFRGGPLYYADTVGLGRIHERSLAFQREHGRASSRRRSWRGWRAKARASASTTGARGEGGRGRELEAPAARGACGR
jgi:3-hydroxyacyl-CoA dehydrogenase